MIIRKVKKHECSLIVQILKDSAEYLHQKGINQWKEPISEKEIADDIELKRVFIVQKILGKKLGIFSIRDMDYFWPVNDYNKDTIYFYKFTICREYLGRGLGASIYSAIEKRLQKKYKKIRLDCWAGNNKLKEFYKNLGFKEKGDFPESDYYISLFEKEMRTTTDM